MMESLDGRSEQLAELEAFLRDSTKEVMWWNGWPGAGKSRLMIAFADRACELGYQVHFVAPDVHDLRAVVNSLSDPRPILLLWDDYRGENPEALRVLLDLATHKIPGVGLRDVKRVITSWPTTNVLGEKALEPGRYLTRELKGVVPHGELVAFAQRLLPQLSPAQAGYVVGLAEGHPEAVIQAAMLVLGGEKPEALHGNLMEASHDKLLFRLKEEGLQLLPLIAVAMVGSVDLEDGRERGAFAKAGVTQDGLAALVKARTISVDGSRYFLSLDSFRAHVVGRLLRRELALPLYGGPEEVGRIAQPLLPVWFREIWMTALRAGVDEGERLKARAALLAAWDGGVGELREADAVYAAEQLFGATAVEPQAAQRGAIAERIGKLMEKFPTPEIALALAKALVNATVIEADAGECLAIADGIGRLVDKFSTQEIALAQAKALYNATIGELDADKCFARAERIGEILVRFPSAEIALEQARALYNATFGEPDSGERFTRAERIGGILERFPSAEIALEQAKALMNATADEPDAGERFARAERIGVILERFPSAEIALERLKAIGQSVLQASDWEAVPALLAEIEGLVDRFDDRDLAWPEFVLLTEFVFARETDLARREAFTRRADFLRTKWEFEG